MPTKLIDILDEMNMKESDTRHRVQRQKCVWTDVSKEMVKEIETMERQIEC